jgi:hypothetical protein
MNNRHQYIQKYGQEYCCKCETRFDDLYSIAKNIEPQVTDYTETFGELVNRLNPCISDEEALIKKALE